MKHLILYATAILCYLSTIPCFSQTVYKVDEVRIFSWDENETPPDWTQEVVEQYTYGNEGNKETILIGLIFPSMDNVYKHIKTYNANNDIIKSIYQSWNPIPPGSWVNVFQTIYSYLGPNKLEYITNQTYNSGTGMFADASREWIEYSGAYAIRQTNQNKVGANWVNVEKTEITNNGSGQPITAFYSKWNAAIPDWFLPYEKDTATYDTPGGLLLEVLSEDLIDTSKREKSTYTYMNGLLTILEFKQSMDGGANYIPIDRERNSYDSNGNNIELIFDEYENGSWVSYYKAERDYSVASPFILSSNVFNIEKFKVFPNPASNIINLTSTFGIDRVEMYDILGNHVLTTQNTKQINVETLKTGVYFLKAFSEKSTTTKKVVIK